jgi:hypothetical protein
VSCLYRYVKSGGDHGRYDPHVQNMIDSDEQRHFTAAERIRAKQTDTSGAAKVGISNGASSYTGSGGFQATGMYDDDDDDDDGNYNSNDDNGGWYEGDNEGEGRPGDEVITRWKRRTAQDEHGACWNHNTRRAYDILWKRVHAAVVAGENHNTSHTKEHMEYRVKSIICRKVNPEIQMKEQDATYNGKMRRTGLKGSVDGSGGGGGGGSSDNRSHTFHYHEHEMAELQLHTVYSFNERDKGRQQWCHIGENGQRQFFSTHMLITKMRRETEYPILVFYEKSMDELNADISTSGLPTEEMESTRRKNRRTHHSGITQAAMAKMTGAGGDSAISSSTFGLDTTASRSELVNAVLKIESTEAGPLSFDTASLINDSTWLEKLQATQEKVDQEKIARQNGNTSLEGFANNHDEREQCCSLS